MVPTGDILKILYNIIKSSAENGNQVLLSEDNRNIIKNLMQQIKRVQTLEEHAVDFQVEFGTSILNLTDSLPLEVLWWLQSAQLIYLNTYIYYNVDYSACLSEQIVDLLCSHTIVVDDQEEPSIDTSAARIVARDMMTEMWIASEGPEITFSKWGITSDELVNSIISECINRLFTSERKPCNYLKDVRNTGKLSDSIIRKINLQHLRLILRNKPCSAMEAVASQGMWTFENSHLNVVSILSEIITNVQTPMQHILEILNEDVVSWECFLTAISVCLKVHPDSAILLNTTVDEIILKALVASSSEKLITAFLMARQACNEGAVKFESYGSWYSKHFGPDSVSKTATKKEIFTFFIKFLSDLIPYEPDLYLQVHISKSLATPPRCMFMVKDFKDIARSRSNDFKIKKEIEAEKHSESNEDEIMIID